MRVTAGDLWREGNTADRLILCVYFLAFTGATYNHAMDLFRHGLFPYTRLLSAPPALNAYWTALTILDPLSMALLALHVPVGIVFYLCVMVSDVAVNWYAQLVLWPQPLMVSYGLFMQTAFLIFLALTCGRLWRHARGRGNAGP